MFTIAMMCAAFAAAGEPKSAPKAAAGDWPCFRGAQRDGISRENGLLKTWPAGGPKLLWTFSNAGLGYSAPSVVAGKLYLMGDRGGEQTAFCVDVKTGKEDWSAKVGKAYPNGWGEGPRSTPTVDGDSVYCLGGGGELVCLAAADGKVRWQKNLVSDFGGKGNGNWGYTESPVADGDKLVCTPGGNKGTVLALNKKTGAPIWQSRELTDGAQYSSLTPADIGGVHQYVCMTGQSVAGIAAADGKLLWRFAREGKTAAIPSPVVHENHVYATSGYASGCCLIKVTGEGSSFKAEGVYSNGDMSNHHGGVILVDSHIYGHAGNNGRQPWVCQDLLTGKIVWSESRFEKGSIACADGMLYCYGEKSGTVVLVEASAAGWKEHGRLTLPKQTKQRNPKGGIWTHPVIADGKLFLRDQELLFCFDIKAK